MASHSECTFLDTHTDALHVNREAISMIETRDKSSARVVVLAEGECDVPLSQESPVKLSELLDGLGQVSEEKKPLAMELVKLLST